MMIPDCPKCGGERREVPVLPMEAPGSLQRAQALEAVRWRAREGRWRPDLAWLCPRCASREYLLPPEGLPLRGYLARAGVSPLLSTWAEDGVLQEALAAAITEHVLTIASRVDRLSRSSRSRVGLLLAAALHHEPPDKTFNILEEAGLAELAPFVADMLVGFGAIWRLEGERALEEYLRLRSHLLEDLLLFEVAHEGGATEEIWRAARKGGLGDRLSGWLPAIT